MKKTIYNIIGITLISCLLLALYACNGSSKRNSGGDETIEILKKKAEEGDAEAQYKLGVEYMGKGNTSIPENCKEAFKWFEKAAQNGYLAAYYNIGYCYMSGAGVKPNVNTAIEYFQKGAELGDPAALNALGAKYLLDGSPKALKKGNELIKRAANQEFAGAEYNLGMSYVTGRGITQNINKGFRLIEKSANQGYALAQFQLGLCYLQGVGVSPNREEAVRWFDKAKKQNDLEANLSLIKLYLDENYDFDKQEGIKLLKQMSESGYSVYADLAQEILAELNVK